MLPLPGAIVQRLIASSYETVKVGLNKIPETARRCQLISGRTVTAWYIVVPCELA